MSISTKSLPDKNQDLTDFLNKYQIKLLSLIKNSKKSGNMIFFGYIDSPSNLLCIKNKKITSTKNNEKVVMKNVFTKTYFEQIYNENQRITVEKYEGLSLKKILEEKKDLSKEIIIKISIKILQKLEILNNNNIVYSNLKPSNIIIKDLYSKNMKLYLLYKDNMIDIDLIKKNARTNFQFDRVKPNKFSSVNLIKNEKIDYKSDLESLFYLMNYLINGGKFIYRDFVDKKILIEELKLSVYKSKLQKELKNDFYDFLIYVDNLKYKEIPNHKYLMTKLDSNWMNHKENNYFFDCLTNSSSKSDDKLIICDLSVVIETREEEINKSKNRFDDLFDNDDSNNVETNFNLSKYNFITKNYF